MEEDDQYASDEAERTPLLVTTPTDSDYVDDRVVNFVLVPGESSASSRPDGRRPLVLMCPDETIQHIFSYLDPSELFQISHVNSEFSRISSAPELWRHVLISSNIFNPVTSWYEKMLLEEEDVQKISDSNEEEGSSVDVIAEERLVVSSVRDYRVEWREFIESSRRKKELLTFLANSGLGVAENSSHSTKGPAWYFGGYRTVGLGHIDPKKTPHAKFRRMIVCLHWSFWFAIPIFSMVFLSAGLLCLLVASSIGSKTTKRSVAWTVLHWVSVGSSSFVILLLILSLVETIVVDHGVVSCFLHERDCLGLEIFGETRFNLRERGMRSLYLRQIRNLRKNSTPDAQIVPFVALLFGLGSVLGSCFLVLALLRLFPTDFALLGIPWGVLIVLASIFLIYWLFYLLKTPDLWGESWNVRRAYPLMCLFVVCPNVVIPMVFFTVILVIFPYSSSAVLRSVFGGLFILVFFVLLVVCLFAVAFLACCQHYEWSIFGNAPPYCSWLYDIVTCKDCECWADAHYGSLGTTSATGWILPGVLGVGWLSVGLHCFGVPAWACILPLFVGSIVWLVGYVVLCLLRQRIVSHNS